MRAINGAGPAPARLRARQPGRGFPTPWCRSGSRTTKAGTTCRKTTRRTWICAGAFIATGRETSICARSLPMDTCVTALYLAGARFDFTLAAPTDSMSGRVGADPSQIVKKSAEHVH
jgi:hypothetical protein